MQKKILFGFQSTPRDTITRQLFDLVNYETQILTENLFDISCKPYKLCVFITAWK